MASPARGGLLSGRDSAPVLCTSTFEQGLAYRKNPKALPQSLVSREQMAPSFKRVGTWGILPGGSHACGSLTGKQGVTLWAPPSPGQPACPVFLITLAKREGTYGSAPGPGQHLGVETDKRLLNHITDGGHFIFSPFREEVRRLRSFPPCPGSSSSSSMSKKTA